MSKSLIIVKEHLDNDVFLDWYIPKAKIVETPYEIMESYPMYVVLCMACNDDECGNFVESCIAIKTSKHTFKTIRKLLRDGYTVDVDVGCPICGNLMVIDEIEIASQEEF